MLKSYNNLTMTKKIYISTALGIFIGMFFGDRCAVLSSINLLFIQLFQIAIIPYMIFSIIHSIGSMSGGTARTISKKGGLILLAVWIPSIIFAFLLPLAFPSKQPASFFHPTSLSDKSINLVDMFIPSNPFHSIAEGYIPAIVIFCMLIGGALINANNKTSFLEQINFLSHIMSKVNKYVMATMPLGVLIIASYTFGTLEFASLKEMLVYIVTSLFYLLFISLLFSPALVVSTTKVGWRKLRDYGLPASLLAFSTGNVFLALPLIYDAMYKFDSDQDDCKIISDEQRAWRQNIIDIVVPLAWVVPASYKFLVVFFIQFSSWYYSSTQPLLQQVMLYIAGIPALFGSNSVIVPFFLQVSRLPEQSYNLFMLVSNFLVYFNNANGAIFIIICTILCYCALTGKATIRWHRLVGWLVLCCTVFALAITGMHYSFNNLLSNDTSGQRQLAGMEIDTTTQSIYHEVTPQLKTAEDLEAVVPRNDHDDLLEQILYSNELRVGFFPDAIPFAFINGKNQLVGYDIAMAYDLGGQLDIGNIEFYPIKFDDLTKVLDSGKVDIVMSGILPRLFSHHGLTYSSPYVQLHPAIVVPLSIASKYSSYKDILSDHSLSLGMMNGGDVDSIISTIIPNRKIAFLQTRDDFYVRHMSDVLLTSAEAGATEIMKNPMYKTFVIPDLGKGMFCAYPLAEHDNVDSFLHFVNNWLLGSQLDGSLKANYDYWILGKTTSKPTNRWSILDWLQSRY